MVSYWWGLMEICPQEIGRKCSLAHHGKALMERYLPGVTGFKTTGGRGAGGSFWLLGVAGLCVLQSAEAREAA